MGQNPDIALAAAAAILALIWALALVWHDLRRRGYAPYESLRRAAGELDGGDASAALRAFRRASRIAARDGDLAALAAAWRGIERARDATGDGAGARAAQATAEDAERQLKPHSKTA